jgi:hypothetical protein
VITLPAYYSTKNYHTDVLTEKQLNFVAHNLPEPSSTIGRPAYTNQELLPGILKVLRSGCPWRDLYSLAKILHSCVKLGACVLKQIGTDIRRIA